MTRTMIAGFMALLLVSAPAVSVAQAQDRERLTDREAEAIIDSLAVNQPLKAADELSAGWRHQEAIAVLETAADTTDPEVLWRLARSHIDIGENMVDQDAAEPRYQLAIDQANRILDNDPDHAEAHLRIATASGRIALLKGPFSAAGLVKDAYNHAHLAKANADSIPVAYYILGRTHKKLMEKSGLARRLAGLSFAQYDSIEFYFKRALRISNGQMIQARVEYADYLLQQEEDSSAASTQLEAALDLPLRDEHDEEFRERALKMLRQLRQP